MWQRRNRLPLGSGVGRAGGAGQGPRGEGFLHAGELFPTKLFASPCSSRDPRGSGWEGCVYSPSRWDHRGVAAVDEGAARGGGHLHGKEARE